MAFNSFSFLFLLGSTLIVYVVAPTRVRVGLLLAASVVFYSSWSVSFLVLPLCVAVSSFLVARAMTRCDQPMARRLWLVMGVAVNLGLLALFKYSGFVVATLRQIPWTHELPATPLDTLVLPLAISFFTFQATGFLVDTFRGDAKPPRSISSFLLFILFFPQLIAGPIERGKTLLPQLEGLRKLRVTGQDAAAGVRLIVLGLVYKCVFADNLAQVVDPVFADPGGHSAGWHFAATYGFTLQLFFDFAGYTHIARGSARLFGITLSRNFNLPFLAENPSDLWRRWHITLSEWFRDYLYKPLGGNRTTDSRTAFNLLLTMAVGGLWHGASWNFVVWGVYHGLLLILYRVLAPIVRPFTGWLPHAAARILRVTLMLHLWALGMLVFRAETLTDAWQMLGSIGIWGASCLTLAAPLNGLTAPLVYAGVTALVVFLMWMEDEYRLLRRSNESTIGYAVCLAVCIMAIATLAPSGSPAFVYFQF